MKRLLDFFLIALVGTLATAAPASAYDMGDSNLLIPIAARVPGAFATEWRTDLVITNLEPEPVNLFVTFHNGPTSGSFTSHMIPGLGTLVLEDVLSRTLLVDSGMGMLRVSSASPGVRFTARAYIYNRGNTAGEFGQGVPAVPVEALGQEHVLSGIIAVGGSRTNVGVANPWSTEADVILTLHSGTGELIGTHALTISAETVVQLNDIFAVFDAAPLADASIRVLGSLPVHAYASIVRNDTGDAIFVGGTGVSRTPGVLAPRCGEPAPLIHPYRDEEPADETVIEFRAGTMRQYIDFVAVQRGFTISTYFDGVPAVAALLTPQQIAAIRCDTAVKLMRRDGATTEP